jgi:hypothetical protein
MSLDDKSDEFLNKQQEAPTVIDNETIRKLALLKPVAYDRARVAKAKELGIRPAVLDAEVKAAKSTEKTSKLPFPTIEPYPYQINPTQLLNEVTRAIQQFIVLDEHQAQAAALWCALTYFVDVIEIAPLAIINAPERACGKTQLLNVIGKLSYRPLPAANASASALFRAVELWSPTILIDEADTFFGDNPELHGMVNAGYARGGFVLRSESVGDSFEPTVFSVYSAKALAGIKLEKHLPDSTMSRGVIFNLRRKLSGESVSRLRHADPDLFTGLASKLARFAKDYSGQVRISRPDLPDALSDRDQDNWDGMLAIASCAGNEWISKALGAALKLSESSGENTVSAGNELLSDIQSVFESRRINKISTTDLIEALCDDEEAPWLTYNRGSPIVPRQFKKQLEPYGIESKKITVNLKEVRGFTLSQFNDSFARYLTPPVLSVYTSIIETNPETTRLRVSTDNKTARQIDNYLSELQPTNGQDFDGKTDKTGFLGIGGNVQINDGEITNAEYF